MSRPVFHVVARGRSAAADSHPEDDLELRLFSTIMTLGPPQDVRLQELHLETFFPAGDASEQAWRRLASGTAA